MPGPLFGGPPTSTPSHPRVPSQPIPGAYPTPFGPPPTPSRPSNPDMADFLTARHAAPSGPEIEDTSHMVPPPTPSPPATEEHDAWWEDEVGDGTGYTDARPAPPRDDTSAQPGYRDEGYTDERASYTGEYTGGIHRRPRAPAPRRMGR